MILVDLFVNDKNLQEKLLDVIRMTSSCIEERENRLRNIAEKEKQKRIKAEKNEKQEKQKRIKAEKNEKQEKQKRIKAEKRINEVNTILKENRHNQKTIQKILAIISKI